MVSNMLEITSWLAMQTKYNLCLLVAESIKFHNANFCSASRGLVLYYSQLVEVNVQRLLMGSLD